jgi:transcriptional/translational regulatory protein YebC/TACO1
VASVRAIFSKHGGNLGATGSVAFQFRKMGVFRLKPEDIGDQDDLELYLIDYGLDEMGESTGDKGEPQIVARCAFADFGRMQEALEKRGLTPVKAEHEYLCTAPVELPEAQANEVLAMIDKLEQDDDVQNVYHSLL